MIVGITAQQMPNTLPVVTSYDDAISTGDRRGIITMTTNINASPHFGAIFGNITNLIDGGYGNDTYWNVAGGNNFVSGRWIHWDMVTAKVIDEFKYYADIVSNCGVWDFQGSNDNATWTTLLAGLTFQSGTFPFTNTTAYRYYRLNGVSGTLSSAAWQREFEFKAASISNGIALVGRKFIHITNTSAQTISISSLTGGLASAPAAGDLVVITHTGMVGWGASDMDYTVTGYTEWTDLYAFDDRGNQFGMHAKFMGPTPDTTADINASSQSNNRLVLVEVWRGVNAATPLDVAVGVSTGTSGAQPVHPSITPVTAGAVIVAVAAQSGNSGTLANTMPDVVSQTNFHTEFISLAAAHDTWVSGTYSPPGWSGYSAGSTPGYCSCVYALRPA